MKLNKKLLILVLSLVMLVGIFTVSAFAAEDGVLTVKYQDGTVQTYAEGETIVPPAVPAQFVAYDADGGKDVVNSETADGDIVYTTVLSGIPLEKKEETMVVRPYAQYEINGKAVTIYGQAASGSLYETAKAIKDAGGEAYENNKTYIDTIVPDAE